VGTLGKPLDSLPPPSGDIIQLSHGRVHYWLRHPKGESEGEGGRRSSKGVLMCVHGFSSEADVFEEFAEYFTARGYSVLSMDLYGRGYSESPDDNIAHDPSFYNGQLVELLYAIGLSDIPLHVVGFSMGGSIAMIFAKHFPAKVKSLTLFAPAGLPTLKPFLVNILKVPLLKNLMYLIGQSVRMKSFEAGWKNHKHLPMYGHIVRQIKDRSNPGLTRALINTLKHFPLDGLRDTIVKVGQHARRVLLIWGDADTTCPYENGIEMHKLMKHSSLVTIPNVGHSAILQEPKGYLSEVEKHLEDANREAFDIDIDNDNDNGNDKVIVDRESKGVNGNGNGNGTRRRGRSTKRPS